MNEFILMWKNALDFKGRARRKEYWMACLLGGIVALILFGLAAITESSILFGLYGLYALALFIPSLSLVVRRLHDVGKSGWYYLISFIPFGAFYILYLLVQDSEAKTNQWGEDPKKNER